MNANRRRLLHLTGLSTTTCAWDGPLLAAAPDRSRSPSTHRAF